MIGLPFLADSIPATNEATVTWLFPSCKEVHASVLQFILSFEVVLSWHNALILRGMKVVVKVASVR